MIFSKRHFRRREFGILYWFFNSNSTYLSAYTHDVKIFISGKKVTFAPVEIIKGADLQSSPLWGHMKNDSSIRQKLCVDPSGLNLKNGRINFLKIEQALLKEYFSADT